MAKVAPLIIGLLFSLVGAGMLVERATAGSLGESDPTELLRKLKQGVDSGLFLRARFLELQNAEFFAGSQVRSLGDAASAINIQMHSALIPQGFVTLEYSFDAKRPALNGRHWLVVRIGIQGQGISQRDVRAIFGDHPLVLPVPPMGHFPEKSVTMLEYGETEQEIKRATLQHQQVRFMVARDGSISEVRVFVEGYDSEPDERRTTDSPLS